jgi:hypothetical protein
MSAPYEAATGPAAEHAGVDPLVDDEANALLALARRVAHTTDDRRGAPLVCYLAGRMLAGEADSGVRVERITGMLDLFPPD